MPVPKRKRSRARRDKRFANKGMAVKAFTVCQNQACQLPLSTHSACTTCGYYKGRKVIVSKAERAAKRGEAKKAKAARHPQKQQEVASQSESE